MRRRFQSAKLQRIDDVLQKTLKKHHIPLKTGDRHLRDVWVQAVGPKIAAQTQPDTIKRNILFIKVANSAWLQSLHFIKDDIINKFNELYKKDPVKNIFFAIGEISAPATEKKDPFFIAGEMPALKSQDKKMIEKSLATVADEELRDILKRAMTKEITRRRMMEKKQDH